MYALAVSVLLLILLKFSEFLKRLNSTVSADKLSDYVHHYTGFSNIYNCRLDIPEIHSEKWVSINDNPKSAINLAKTICTEGQKTFRTVPRNCAINICT